LAFGAGYAADGVAIVVTFRLGIRVFLFYRLVVIKIRKSEYQIRSIDYFSVQGYTAYTS
jgi:hypothetical protein